MAPTATNQAFEKAKAVLLQHGGTLRTGDILRLGVHPRILYRMVAAGMLERLSRGLYRLADLPALGAPDLVTVSARLPDGVICLVSALSFHQITTQIPHAVYVALPRGAHSSRLPRLDHPPLRVFRFSGAAFAAGIETHELDGYPVRIYDVEKTIADCFKYRNKLGLDVALEALKLYRQDKPIRADRLMDYARVCRVARVMRPYLEAIL
jgi:predicted transcriptional regulator of viral defense system